MKMTTNSRGQLLPAVLLVLIILSALVPLMVYFTQSESRWTAKAQRNTTAFHLAEAGIEKGYLALTRSTATWTALQAGTMINDFQFDRSFSDVSGGNYTVSITSGPEQEQATVIAVGIDSSRKETRAIKAVYANMPLGGISVFGSGGVDVSGSNMSVEWGSIMSPNTVTPNSEDHPSLWSAGGITGFDTDPSPPNCDSPNCWRYHAYYANIPPEPVIDFEAYKSSADASGVGPCGSYYTVGNKDGSCNDSSGKPYYVTGNWTDFEGSIVGNVIILGSLDTPNGNNGGGSYTNVPIPQKAWKEYCDDWSFFETNFYDTPFSQCPGINSSYVTPSTATYSGTITPLVRGMLYVGGDFTGPNGGANVDMVLGVLYVRGNVYLNSNSHVSVWYSEDASRNMLVNQLYLTRSSWQDILRPWPSGLAY